MCVCVCVKAQRVSARVLGAEIREAWCAVRISLILQCNPLLCAPQPPECVPWVHAVLDECVTPGAGVASAFFGIASICFWIPAQFPYVMQLGHVRASEAIM